MRGQQNSSDGLLGRRENTPPINRVALYVALVLWALVATVPILWAAIAGLKSQMEVLLDPFSLPAVWQWSHYLEAWVGGNLQHYFLNSLIVSTSSVFLTLALAAPAAFAFARLRFRARWLFLVFIAMMIIPVQVLLVPLFIIFRTIRLLDNWLALILANTAVSLPFTIYFLRSFFRELPKEIADAARIDGCDVWRLFWSVMLPLAQPALASMAIFVFVWSWNELLFAIVFLRSGSLKTLPPGILDFIGENDLNLPVLIAGTVIAMVPSIVVYLGLQGRLVKGMTAGAIKG